jgi:MtN3 and saliva related transmembrane protein
MVSWLAAIAGILTTASFIPQVSRAWRTRSTGDLSLGMLITFNGGVLCWLVYGWLTSQVAVVLANGVTLGLSLSLLFLKLRWG